MYNFDYRQHVNRRWPERFPDWANGYDAWKNQIDDADWPARTLRFLPPYAPLPPTPRLFVSHRQADTALAERVAYLADDAGYDFWLDVLDPALYQLKLFLKTAHLTPQQESKAIASVIEMGLINCTHVLVLMTPNCVGSEWIYYEYGFAKRVPVAALPASAAAAPSIESAWVHPNLGVARVPGYMLLSPHHLNDAAISQWLGGTGRARTAWNPIPPVLP